MIRMLRSAASTTTHRMAARAAPLKKSANAGGTSLAARVSPVGMVNTIGGAAVTANYGAPAIKSATVNPGVAYNKLAHQRLQRYLLPHTDEATLNTPQGMMPYARVASFQAGE